MSTIPAHLAVPFLRDNDTHIDRAVAYCKRLSPQGAQNWAKSQAHWMVQELKRIGWRPTDAETWGAAYVKAVLVRAKKHAALVR